MAKAISGVSFSTELIRSDPDYFFKDESVAAASGPATVVEKMLGNIQSGVEIVVEVEDAITVGANALTIVINRAPTAGGTKVAVRTFPAYSNTTIAAGTKIGSFVPTNNEDGFYSVGFTSNAANAGSLNAFQHPIPR